MSRAVFMATAGDPFSTLMVIKLWQKHWYDEVDAFYVNVNNHCGCPTEVEQELITKLMEDPKIHIIFHPKGIGNGPPVTEMVHLCRQDYILLLEEDGFVFSSGIVDKCFQKIESDLVDAVGSPRFSCGNEVGEAAREKWHLNYGGYGDVGPNFWPNFFFCKKSDLLRTDLDFGSHTWQAGETCPILNHTFKEVNHGDTFVWACLQLRNLGLRFENVPQHKADPYELESKQKNEMNFHPTQQPFHWVHGGSLSAGWGGYLSGRIPDVSADIAKREMETRVAFWSLCLDVTEGFEAFKEPYRNGIEQLKINADLNKSRIDNKYIFYKELLKL